MERMTLDFLKPGLHTLIQDMGRITHKEYGVPLGGALDRSSAIIANALVGNDPNSPVFEITIIGPRIKFAGDKGSSIIIAISGADLSPTLDDHPIDMYMSIEVRDGSILAFGKLQSGCRAYLAVRGEWQVRKWLGSASAIFPDLPEVTPDSFIQKGSSIDILHSDPNQNKDFSGRAKSGIGNSSPIRIFPGPEIGMFDKEALSDFCRMSHTILPSSNRWGYLIDSCITTHEVGAEIISSGVIPGTIQITHSGTPVILMADAQTTGGYPRFAVVAATDMDRLAQFKPGDAIRFELVK